MAASTRSIHSRQRAAGGRVGKLDVEGLFALSPAAARRGAHRPYSRNVGPARKTRARRRARRAGRTAGGRRGRSSARGAPLRRARRNLRRAAGRRFWRPVSTRSLGATAIRVFERRERSAARSRAEAAASAIAPAAAFRPGWVARPWPSRCARPTAGSDPEFS